MPRGIPKNGINTGRFRKGDPALKIKTPAHRKAISEAQKLAWQTKRVRMPIGAKYKDSYGYIRIKVVAGSGRWRLEHALVMERTIGRSIKKGEIVHHINGQRDDNRPENLFLCSSHAEHMKIERSLAVAFRSMLESGQVRFNRKGAQYEALLR